MNISSKVNAHIRGMTDKEEGGSTPLTKEEERGDCEVQETRMEQDNKRQHS